MPAVQSAQFYIVTCARTDQDIMLSLTIMIRKSISVFSDFISKIYPYLSFLVDTRCYILLHNQNFQACSKNCDQNLEMFQRSFDYWLFPKCEQK